MSILLANFGNCRIFQKDYDATVKVKDFAIEPVFKNVKRLIESPIEEIKPVVSLKVEFENGVLSKLMELSLKIGLSRFWCEVQSNLFCNRNLRYNSELFDWHPVVTKNSQFVCRHESKLEALFWIFRTLRILTQEPSATVYQRNAARCWFSFETVMEEVEPIVRVKRINWISRFLKANAIILHYRYIMILTQNSTFFHGTLS